MNDHLVPTSHKWAKHERVILFDGICNWCNAWVTFTIDHDPQTKFKFGTLQSEPAQQILTSLRLPTEGFETFLLLEHGQVYTNSAAVLRIVKQLSGFWPFFYLGIVIPRPLRDAAYHYIARHRYEWMGKSNTCRIPTPAERGRFV